MSGLVLTPVTVTKPTRGSLRSVAIASDRTALMASSTRRMRPPRILASAESFALRAHTSSSQILDRGQQSLDAGSLRTASEHPALHPVGRLGYPAQRPAGEGRGQRRALPQILIPGLGHGHAEAPVQLGLDRAQLLALALQAAGVREMKLDHEYGDEPSGGHQRTFGPDGPRGAGPAQASDRPARRV